MNAEISTNITLYPFQQTSVTSLTSSGGGLLLDEQGLGKTIQAIACLANHFQFKSKSKNKTRALIVCPAIMRWTWIREIEQSISTTMQLTVQLLQKNAEEIDPTARIVVCSYEYLSHNYTLCRGTKTDLIKQGFTAVVVDESHKIKNIKSIRTKAALHVLSSENVQFKLLLTGTPITAGVDDLYTQLYPFFNDVERTEQLGRNIYKFRDKYMFSKQGAFGMEWYGVKDKEKLKEILYSRSIRRTKKEVLKDLPAIVRKSVYIPIKTKNLAEMSMKYVDVALRMVCGDRISIDPTELAHVATMRKTLGLAKVEGCVEYILNMLETEDKLVVFAVHTDVVHAIAESLKLKSLAYCVRTITGDTSISTRDRYIQEFNTSVIAEGSRSKYILVLNIVAGGVGVTLNAAHVEIFAELDWTPANMMQAEARCHRIGQTKNVLVVHMLAAKSIDEAITHTLASKMSVVDSVV